MIPIVTLICKTRILSIHLFISDPSLLPQYKTITENPLGLIKVPDVVSHPNHPLLSWSLLWFCQVIREALQKDIAVMQKSSPIDLVTETDQRVEQLIISSIKEKYPTHRYWTKERC